LACRQAFTGITGTRFPSTTTTRITFPAKDGFAQGVAELKAAGVFPMPYINGRLWDSHDRGAEDFEFSKLALAAATKQDDGLPCLEKYGSKETNGEPVRLGVMCPATPLWQNTVSNIVLRLLGECGTSAVYIDQVAAAAPRLCMDRRTAIPWAAGIGGTRAIGRCWRPSAVRMPRDTALTTECNAEPFIRWFDGYLTWHWQHDGTSAGVPGGLWRHDPDVRTRLSRRRHQGFGPPHEGRQQLVFGEQLGWLDPGVVKEKENAEFFRQMVRTARGIQPLLLSRRDGAATEAPRPDPHRARRLAMVRPMVGDHRRRPHRRVAIAEGEADGAVVRQRQRRERAAQAQFKAVANGIRGGAQDRLGKLESFV
jgi:hypothetical protein